MKGLPTSACIDTASCQSPYRTLSPVFDYQVPAFDNTLSVFGGACYNNPNHGRPYTAKGAVGDGFFVMINPLPPGLHTIRWGKLDAVGNPTRLYTIRVVDSGHH
jgi:hypothetical protein